MESKSKLIGRGLELKLLEEYIESDRSEFIAVYGRRRVGKTFLIRQVVSNKACFALTGMENASMKDQLANFFFTLRRVYPKATQPTFWIEVFDELETYLEHQPKGKNPDYRRDSLVGHHPF